MDSVSELFQSIFLSRNASMGAWFSQFCSDSFYQNQIKQIKPHKFVIGCVQQLLLSSIIVLFYNKCYIDQ